VRTTPLNVLDQLYLHLDREEEAWSVHVEIRASGSIDADRLADAVREAALAHPIARARLSDTRATDVRYRWEVADALDELDLEEVDGDRLARSREALLSRSPRLDRPGPFALLLAHDPAGDVVVLNLHHSAGDGLSALRLMGSIARAYAGEDDPTPPVDALEVRDVTALARPDTIGERLTRARAALEYLERGVSAPSRIHAKGGRERAGYGFAFTAFDPDELQQLVALGRGRATVNDVLLGGLALAVRHWNAAHAAPCDAIYLTMPVNLRPPEWRQDVVGNFASYVSIRVASADQATREDTIQAAADSTRHVKDDGVAGLLVDLFNPPTLLPTGLKQRMQDLIPLTGNLVVDTAVLSNLGRVQDAPELGDAGAIRELWFSPPGRMPLGASLGVATLDGRLFVTLRYRHAQFDAAAADEFLATFKSALLEG
jgi:NRPS condensation-like uncharacterized protein